ncbi:Site-specific recombinase XerD [[Luteovulum] sphaeroides subsp. megalophilum]|uniref:tyrosine-type recombinase/integrase n=1 Tax=Cereibacter sphaeroides TaxID=1063 RepID=UPI000B7494CF|nr:tyrosine-type recombinase/integrase [Cereibacter sphaeroides]SNT41762.1 Site-specific recombinase XerD [[Luteovulum] sphaeroides subsp. megalophilum]
MFEEIFLQPAAAKHRNAPLADPRAGYLLHLKAGGAQRTTLRKHANAHLNLVRLLGLRDGDRISQNDIETAAKLWANPEGRRSDRAATNKAKQRFVSHCADLLHHLGWIEPDHAVHPYATELSAYETWLRKERGLSAETIRGYCRAAEHLLTRIAVRGVLISALSIADIDDIIGDEHRRGVWSRRTLHDFAQRLRSFIAFAEKRQWCRPGLAAGIVAPGYMDKEVLPKGVERNDVERLLASVSGERTVDLRDRAILMLFSSYGLRVAEVAGLRLDDLDWDADMLRVRCPKPGRTHLWPLSQEVGQAILDYLQHGRPTGYGRAVFFTSRAPIRPLDRKALGKIVRDRLAGVGVLTGRRGPHALRHAAAQHLLDRGVSMKVIGDFLGHRNPSSTAIYAKVDLAALREVAALDLEALL